MDKPFTTKIYNNDISDSSMTISSIIGLHMNLANNIRSRDSVNVYDKCDIFIRKYELQWIEIYDILFTIKTRYSYKITKYRPIFLIVLNSVFDKLLEEYNE